MNTSEQTGEIARLVENLVKRLQIPKVAHREADVWALWGKLVLDRPGLTIDEVRAALKEETECST